MSCSREEMYQALPALPYCKRRKAGRGTGNEAKGDVHLFSLSVHARMLIADGHMINYNHNVDMSLENFEG